MNVSKKSPLECSIKIPYRYTVEFTHGVFDLSNPTLTNAIAKIDNGESSAKVCVWFDAGLVKANPDITKAAENYFRKNAPTIILPKPAIFPGGEDVKNGFTHVNDMIDDLRKAQFCRHSYLIAVGGGAFLDAAGFAAALFHRGIRLIRLPSTTLSQDDSGVGVKNGINLENAKNVLGTFAPPLAVINDLDFLKTLEPSVRRDGIAEAFKVAIIKDKKFFDFLSDNTQRLRSGAKDELHNMIKRCAKIHLKHIETNGDPFEVGSARPLDFGHWAGHRLEAMSGYVLRHGEGVAIGIALDSYYAMRNGLIANDELELIVSALYRSGLPVFHPLLARKTNGDYDVMQGIEQFREHLGGNLSITLPNGIGQKIEVSTMDRSILIDGIKWLSQWKIS